MRFFPTSNNPTRSIRGHILALLTLCLCLGVQAQEKEPVKVGPTQTVEQSIEALFGPDQGAEPAPEDKPKTPSDPNAPVLYIADTNNGRIVVMQGIKGEGFTSIGLPGYGFGRFMRPAQLWVDYAGRLHIADSGNNRVVRIDQKSEQAWTELEGLQSPQGVAVDKDGVYVAETKANRVVRVKEIKKDSPVLETLTHPQLDRPTSLWIDKEGALYICSGEDPPGGKVFKTWMEKDRRRWKMFEGDGLSGSRFRPSGIVTAGPGVRFLDGSGSRVVTMQNMAGRRIKEHRFRENRRWRLSRPQGLATDKTGRRLFIADSGNDRILEIRADGSIVGEFTQLEGDPASVLRNPTSVFVFSPAPAPEPEDDDDDDDKKKGK